MTQAIEGFDKKQRTAWTNIKTLEWLVRHGYITVETDFFKTESFTPPEGWMEANKFEARAPGPESEKHKRLKVLAAVYLDINGCELRKYTGNLLGSDNVCWEYQCFESASEYGHSDLSCLNCVNVVECGTTEPKKCISALGIDAQPRQRSIRWDEELLSDPDTLRVSNYDDTVNKFITMPYSGVKKNEDRQEVGYKMFIYERGQKLD